MKTNYIYEYYQQIKEGQIIAGKKIIEWYSLIIKGIEEKKFFYSAKDANKAIKFIENFVHHHEGALAPQLVKLELWQKAFLSVIFGILDEQGLRQFREVVLVVGRKSGKTLIASGIAEYMTFLDDYGARTYFFAPKLQQASLCFEAFAQSIRYEPELDALAKKRRTDIYVETRNASAQPFAFSSRKSDGLNVSCGIADEVAAFEGEAGLRFYEVIKSSMGARKQPLLLSITTANFINDSVYDELMKRCTAVLNGSSKETRLAPFLYTIDDVAKWDDINEIMKANPNLGVSVSVDYMLEEIAIAHGSLSKKSEFLTKYCNIKQNASISWLSTDAVVKCSGEPITKEFLKSSYCVGGIDLSMSMDLTAANVVVEKNGEFYVFAHFWLPEEKIDEATARDGLPYREFIQRGFLSVSGQNLIDYNDVFTWFRELVEDYEILPLMVGYDRYSSQYLIKDMNAYGFHTDDVYQGFNLTPAIVELEALVKDGRLHVGDNDLLKCHLLDTALKIDTESKRYKIIKMNHKVHIDGVAALLCSLIVKQKHCDTIGEQLKNIDY